MERSEAGTQMFCTIMDDVATQTFSSSCIPKVCFPDHFMKRSAVSVSCFELLSPLTLTINSAQVELNSTIFIEKKMSRGIHYKG